MVALTKLTYKRINNLLTKEEIALLSDYCKSKHMDNNSKFDFEQNNNGDTFFYKDFVMQALLKSKKEIFEKATDIKLLEAYTFWRCYTYNAILERHRDRPSCEISATICIDSDGTKWPIYMGGTPMELNPGDAVIYNGCHIEHWREAFTGDYQMQVFLHYVDANGPYKEFANDNEEARKKYGL